MRFFGKYAELILAGKKTLELRSHPPKKEIYPIVVGRKVLGRFRVKKAYRVFIPDMTKEELSRAGFEDGVHAMREAVRLNLWPECWAWEIELIDARGAARSARRGPRPRHRKGKGGDSHVGIRSGPKRPGRRNGKGRGKP